MDKLKSIFSKYYKIDESVTDEQLVKMFIYLNDIINSKIEGDIIEMGCKLGTTSIFIQSLLIEWDSQRKFHVYDSFQGLPKKHLKDKTNLKLQYNEGDVGVSISSFKNSFEINNIPLPVIHEGWFIDIPNNEYPEKIAFAFFDGDFYTSTLDSWIKTYYKLSKGAIVFIHDYDIPELPGPKKATDEFLTGKPEHGTIISENYLGLFIKQ